MRGWAGEFALLKKRTDQPKTKNLQSPLHSPQGCLAAPENTLFKVDRAKNSKKAPPTKCKAPALEGIELQQVGGPRPSTCPSLVATLRGRRHPLGVPDVRSGPPARSADLDADPVGQGRSGQDSMEQNLPTASESKICRPCTL